ncbi:MAG TPA: YbjQ family protein [Thermoanaerobaculia bacterium]|nr:YbjQ family protein [Thermoanaerobaculia bacterium]
MILTTSDQIPGRRITRTLGLVRGNTIRSRHLGRDITAVLRNLVGGEISEYTKLMAESREQALDRMVEEARSLGADAIVAVRFSTSEVMAGAAELLAYGTAVVLEREEDASGPSGRSAAGRSSS